MVWVVSRVSLKAPPGISSSCISPLTSSGQHSRASWVSQPQKSATLSPQPGGKPWKFIRTCGGMGGGRKRKKKKSHTQCNLGCLKAQQTLSASEAMLPQPHSTYDPSLILSQDSCLLLYLTSTGYHFPLAHSTYVRTLSADRPQMWYSRRFKVTNDSC